MDKPPFRTFSGKTALDVLYDFNSTKVNDITPVPVYTKTLAIIRPTDTIIMKVLTSYS